MFSESTTQAFTFGTRFSLDVMKRNRQTILFMEELLSQFCWIVLLENEKAEAIEQAITQHLLPYVHQEGATIRCDGAPSFQSLKINVDNGTSPLAGFLIKFELGQSQHANKNPCAENAIREGHAAINRNENPYHLKPADLAKISRDINFKVRGSGFSSWELLCRRSLVDGEVVEKSDDNLAKDRLAAKLHSHNPPQEVNDEILPGNLVVINSSKTKLKPREPHLVQDIKHVDGAPWAQTYKMGDKITNRPQMVKMEDLTLIPTKRKAALNARQAIKNLIHFINLTQEVPTHAWNHDEWVQQWQEDDSEEEEDEAQPTKPENNEKHEKTEGDLSDNGWGSAESGSSRSSTSRPKLPPRCPSTKTKRSRSPISTYAEITPTHSKAVDLDRVQDLSQVFDGIYTNQGTPRASERLAQLPRRNYLQFHRQGGTK